MKIKTDILVIGAGAAGLMTAKELSKTGKKVTILEARDRIGGRIYPLFKETFGYPAQGGAEFVHGPAPITKTVLKEAGLTYVPINKIDYLYAHKGKLVKIPELWSYENLLNKRLKNLKKDMPIAEFLNKYFKEKKYETLKKLIIGTTENYDAADPKKISTFVLRDEWLGRHVWKLGIIKEGYGSLIKFLELECKNNRVQILFNKKVESIKIIGNDAEIKCADKTLYEAQKTIITVSLPIISSLKFSPAIPCKLKEISKIGFGGVIKILLQFQDSWWMKIIKKEQNTHIFISSEEKVPIWWTQPFQSFPVITGWIGGPNAKKLKNKSPEKILDLALLSLSNIFKIDVNILKEKFINSKVINWPADPFAQGAYSYESMGAKKASAELRKPINNIIFFAGEAFCSGEETATVEGAFASAVETANRILNPK
ncbi:MAG: hypothetical protein COV30_02465 [Candidatus Yanofskybacteria bacterium CG10_big_fil_rev_8_21_14_0_10_37_15]|uniref:Amine oxidase domain-containing protein n=1 Tax=Candidatus Yanofskybacteria bacterium CG10_big_fil_rev_8_21_14_0_10_37_15 TaxID=1975097 RepID=A0A2H0R584_9BACT|nr:MAG: hypothetical protein COV30_02465 [Candidatus Yanofskybacteria bacterium CG10_big_fil_rev_8_21_14_0_10_37_15]